MSRERSPRRGDMSVYRDRDRSRERERSRRGKRYVPFIKENRVPINHTDTDILITPFTFGMEWETYAYYTTKKYYDRQTIFKSSNKKLNATVEDFKLSKIIPNVTEKDKDGCKYTLEMSIGVLGKYPNPTVSLQDFINNDKIFISEISTELADFKQNFLNKNIQNIRKYYSREISDSIFPESFADCSLSIPITEENKSSYSYFYTNKDYDFIEEVPKAKNFSIDELTGRPQVTLGMSYALFTSLLEEYKGDSNIDRTFDIFTKIMNDNYTIQTLQILSNSIENTKGINNINIFNGFFLLIVYYCTLSSLYAHKSISDNYNVQYSLPYFKAAFKLKPRSNLGESYKHLKAEYSLFDDFLKLLYTVVLPSLLQTLQVTFDPSQINSYSSLVEYQLDFIRSEASDNADIISRLNSDIYKDNVNSKYEDIILFMNDINYHKYQSIIDTIIIINIIYLIHKILNPNKVVKLKINRDKIGKDCKFLDGYYYSYEGESKDLIDELVSENYAEIINNISYDFAHTSDPQILIVERGISDISICTSDREELFEYIPEDSNLIVEIRNPERFTENYDNLIEFGDIENFLNELFDSLDNIFKDFIFGPSQEAEDEEEEEEDEEDQNSLQQEPLQDPFLYPSQDPLLYPSQDPFLQDPLLYPSQEPLQYPSQDPFLQEPLLYSPSQDPLQYLNFFRSKSKKIRKTRKGKRNPRK